MAVTSITYTQVGEEQTVARIRGLGATPNKIGIGTGSTASGKSDTALGTEVETRGTATLSAVGGGAGDTLQAVGQVSITAARALREFGLFDAASSGNLYIRGVHDVINLDNGDAIEWTIQLAFS